MIWTWTVIDGIAIKEPVAHICHRFFCVSVVLCILALCWYLTDKTESWYRNFCATYNHCFYFICRYWLWKHCFKPNICWSIILYKAMFFVGILVVSSVHLIQLFSIHWNRWIQSSCFLFSYIGSLPYIPFSMAFIHSVSPRIRTQYAPAAWRLRKSFLSIMHSQFILNNRISTKWSLNHIVMFGQSWYFCKGIELITIH